MKERKLTFRQYMGNKGEDAAAKILKDKGFNILRRNYRIHNVGEIDIIAENGDDLHILEVRTRLNIGYYPDSAESVTDSKRKKVIKTAGFFVAEYNLYDKNLVFEVVMVTHDKKGNIKRIDFIPF